MIQSIKNLIAATLIAISAFLAWTQILPAYDTTVQMNNLVDERSQLLISRGELVKKIESLKEERDNRHSELQRLTLAIPDNKNLPEIISMIEAMFSQTGNVLSDFLITDSALTASPKTVNLELSSGGTYDSLLSLLSAIESNLRLFDVASLEISEDPELQDTGGLNFQIKGKVYWISEESTSPQGQPVAGGGE